MKRNLAYLLILTAVLTTVCVSCSGDDKERHSVSRPTDWTVPSNLHYSDMTVIIDAGTVPDGIEVKDRDLLGAFIDGECRGVAEPVSDVDGLMRFYLVVHSLTSDSERREMQVEMRYYSAEKQHIYTAKPFPFAYDASMGSLASPYAPEWNKD